VGLVPNPHMPVAVAVAASSAFPPILSPLLKELQNEDFMADPKTTLQKPPFTTEVVLSDGGVYDNLGLETACKR
jgi:NTE family protein